MNLARLGATVDSRLEKLADLWDKAPDEDRLGKNRYLEALCRRCGLDPSEFLGICVTIAHRHQVDVVNLVTAAALDDVVAAGVRAAKMPGGTRDRALIYEHKGLIQKGPGVAIQVNTGAGSLPDFKAISEIALQATTPKALPAVAGEVIDAEPV